MNNFNNLKGKSISIEGGEGSGKGTLIESLKEYLKDKGIKAMFTREPGGVPIAEKIREIIVDIDNTEMTSTTEMLLYASARAQHLEQKVMPILKAGNFVVFDRFVDSSYAYQGIARELGLKKVMLINEIATQGFLPDKTIILDIEPEIGLERINTNRRDEINRLDMETIEFHKKVREGYKQLKEIFPDRIVFVNANQDKEKVFQDVLKIIEEI